MSGTLQRSEIHVRRTEGDGLPIVLVHGAMDRNTSFARVAEALAPSPIVRYDRRGYGRSRAAGTGLLAAHVDDLVARPRRPPGGRGGPQLRRARRARGGGRGTAPRAAVGTYEVPIPWVDWWPFRAAILAEDPAGAAEGFLRRHIGDDRWERLPLRWREERRAEGAAFAHENEGLDPPDPPFDLATLVMPVVVGRGASPASGPPGPRPSSSPASRSRGARRRRCRARGAGHRSVRLRRARSGDPPPSSTRPSVASSAMRPLRGLLGRHRPAMTAFVLSGGGVLGALQVGMLRALLEHRIQPDLVLGCSVGALNGVAIAAEPSLAMVGRLQETWLDLEGRDVLPAGLLPTTVQLARKGEAVHGNEGLRTVLEEILPVATFEELAVPFQCVATDIVAAREVWFSSGTLVEPILASAALPAMLPPVEIDGVRYIDGAVVNDVPVTRAVDLGATTIYILHVGRLRPPPPGAQATLRHGPAGVLDRPAGPLPPRHGRPAAPRRGDPAAGGRGPGGRFNDFTRVGDADGQRLPGHGCPAHGPGRGARGHRRHRVPRDGPVRRPTDRRGSGRRWLRHAEWQMSQKTHAGRRGRSDGWCASPAAPPEDRGGRTPSGDTPMLTRFDFIASYVRARFGDTEKGASLVEYALLVALIAVVCILAVTFLGNSADSKFQSVGSAVNG